MSGQGQVSAFFPNAAVPAQADTGPEIIPQPRAAPPKAEPQTEQYADYPDEPSPAFKAGIRAIDSSGRPSPVRFPSHRGALWDRTARGNAVVITPATPHISFIPSLLPQIAQQAAQGEGITHLEGAISAPKEGSGVLPLIDVTLHGLGPGDAATVGRKPPAGCGLEGRQPCAVGVNTIDWPTLTFPNDKELRPPNSAYAELLERSLEAFYGPMPLLLGECIPMHIAATHLRPDHGIDGHALLLRVEALVPTLALKATPLYALGVLNSPLSDSLKPNSSYGPGALRTGYLTMDQSRKLVLLSETDPLAFEVPLVGVWVSGVRQPSDPYAWAACVRYARMSPQIAEAVTMSKDGSNAFLMLAYEEWTDDYGGYKGASVISPQLYEVEPQGTLSPYKLVGRGLQVSLPIPSTAVDAAKCDLFTTESQELSRLMRGLEPFPREGSPQQRLEKSLPKPKQRLPPGVKPAEQVIAEYEAEMAKKAEAAKASAAATEAAASELLDSVAKKDAEGGGEKKLKIGDRLKSQLKSQAGQQATGQAVDMQLSVKPEENEEEPAPAAAAAGGLSGGTETALVAMVTQLLGQVREMGERMEQQETTIQKLTAQLAQASVERKAMQATPVASLASTVQITAPSSPPSTEALRAAVLAATEEERLAMPRAKAAGDDDDELSVEDEDEVMYQMDPDAPMRIDVLSVGGAAVEVGSDPYDEVPRIVYEPDEEEVGQYAEADESEGEDEAMKKAGDDDELAELGF